MRDVLGMGAPVLYDDANVRLGLADRRIFPRADALAQRDDPRIAHAGVAELSLARCAVNERGRDRVIHTELAFQPVARILIAGEPGDERAHREFHPLDIFAPEGVFAPELDAAVDGRVNHEPAGVRLVHVAHQFVALPPASGDHVGIEFRRHHPRETARGLDRLLGTREVAEGEERGGEAVARRAPGMQALAHTAKHFLQACRLGGGDPQRPGSLLRIESEELGRRRRCTEHARGAGNVPAGFVVFRKDRQADALLGFHAQDERMRKLRAAHPAPLGKRQQRRQHRRARMYRPCMGVVEIEHVRAHAVDEGRVQDVETLAPAQHCGLGWAGKRRHRRQRALDGFMPRTADRATEPVQQCPCGLMAHGFGDVLVARSGQVPGERAGDHQAGSGDRWTGEEF